VTAVLLSTQRHVPVHKHMIQAVCFDLDGTLFDDEQYVRGGLQAAADVLEQRTGQSLHEEFESAYFEEEVRERTLDHILAERGLSGDHVPALVEAYPLGRDSVTCYEARSGISRCDTGDMWVGVLTKSRPSGYHDNTAPLTPYPETEQVLDSLASDYRLGLDIAQANRLGQIPPLLEEVE